MLIPSGRYNKEWSETYQEALAFASQFAGLPKEETLKSSKTGSDFWTCTSYTISIEVTTSNISWLPSKMIF